MAWTATYTKELINGVKTIVITYTDGVDTATEKYDAQAHTTEEWIGQRAKGKLDWLNSRDTVFAALPSTPTVPPVPQTPVVVPPTQDELDFRAWIADYHKWIKVKTTLIDTGILTGNEVKVVELKTRVQSTFKPVYLNSI